MVKLGSLVPSDQGVFFHNVNLPVQLIHKQACFTWSNFACNFVLVNWMMQRMCHGGPLRVKYWSSLCTCSVNQEPVTIWIVRHVTVACLLISCFGKVTSFEREKLFTKNGSWFALICFYRSGLNKPVPRIIQTPTRCSQMWKSQLQGLVHMKLQEMQRNIAACETGLRLRIQRCLFKELYILCGGHSCGTYIPILLNSQEFQYNVKKEKKLHSLYLRVQLPWFVACTVWSTLKGNTFAWSYVYYNCR